MSGTVSWFRETVDGPSLWGAQNLIPKPVYVGFVVDKEALGQVFLPLLLLSPVLFHSSVIDVI